MNRYGQAITFSTTSAPYPFTGYLTSYSYREMKQRQLFDDESGEFVELAQTGKKAELSFEADVTDGSTDFLDLSAGAAVTVTGISAGVVLATRATERWQLGQRKTISLQATHYPDIVQASP